jgi:hypothetical protein
MFILDTEQEGNIKLLIVRAVASLHSSIITFSPFWDPGQVSSQWSIVSLLGIANFSGFEPPNSYPQSVCQVTSPFRPYSLSQSITRNMKQSPLAKLNSLL